MCDADGLWGDADAAAVKGRHGDLEALTQLAEKLILGDYTVLEGDSACRRSADA